ncbi:MAG: (Fe-S)-binding protein [Thermoguttaceae bacterium]|nr:(Fe-S)-binding protein [Thermoguttaceae bacterium]MBQ3453705.1 (Fe-S)-binding protein [Thermoguttaceae bacterium]MBQ6620901.1 (Fe-S)-binding protein [Thermoguttaceae bacterium]
MDNLLSKEVPSWEYPQYKEGMRVGLFIPCFIDQFFPTAGISCVKLLEQLGIKVEYPDEQTCCGQPAFNSGYKEEAISVMKKFHRVFSAYDLIVTPSSACAAMCRVFFAEAAPGSPEAATGSRVWELSEFLVNILGKTDFGASFPGKVALHIGCHGRRELGMADAAMTLLTNIRGLQYTPVPNVDECCGFGGTFSVKMAGTSLAMGKQKVANILASGADILATTDLSCAMHFGGIMRHDPALGKMEIIYLGELLLRHD